MRRALVALAATLTVGGCSWFGLDSPPLPKTADTTSSEEILKKNCADEEWKQQNLGLWYSVCRQPLRW